MYRVGQKSVELLKKIPLLSQRDFYVKNWQKFYRCFCNFFLFLHLWICPTLHKDQAPSFLASYCASKKTNFLNTKTSEQLINAFKKFLWGSKENFFKGVLYFIQRHPVFITLFIKRLKNIYDGRLLLEIKPPFLRVPLTRLMLNAHN
jgi:hypothetical protein